MNLKLILFLLKVGCIVFTKSFKVSYGGDHLVDTTALMEWFFPRFVSFWCDVVGQAFIHKYHLVFSSFTSCF